MEPEGGTCATRVTRGTIDFQARDDFELRDEEFARNFHVAFKRGALKITSSHLSGAKHAKQLSSKS